MSGYKSDRPSSEIPGREPPQPRPRRFYKSAGVEDRDGAFQVLLDGRPARTPRKRALKLPTRALAEAIAAEWNAQGETIAPETMPLTRLVNTALDGVEEHRDEIVAAMVAFAASDLLCYRAEGPEALTARQGDAWDPILAWAEADLGARGWVVTHGVMPVTQPSEALARVEGALRPLDALNLAALHVMTALTGSALLALAHARGRLSAEDMWTAAHVDDDWQIAQWGEDWEAAERRSRRRAEMEAASRLLALLRSP